MELNEDLELDLQRIADGLADLSQPSDLPEGTAKRVIEPFSVGEVDFDSGDWLLRLLEVEPWLCLDRPLEHSATPAKVLESLFAQIAPSGEERHFQQDEGAGHWTLTAVGANELADRVDRAQRLKEEFVESLDEGRSRKDVSEQWRTAWEDATEDTSAQRKRFIEGISARVETWKVKSFVAYARENRLDLNPSYQRDSVWSQGESQVLIESIFRGIPLPSVILRLDGEGDEELWQIVDGKQRLTALLRFTGEHPEWRQHVKEKYGDDALALHDASFRKFKKKFSPTKEEMRFAPFPFSKLTEPQDPLASLSSKYYTDVKEQKVKLGEKDYVKVKTIFEEEGGKSQYLIPVILFTETKVEAIHQVFHLYNKQGRKLNAEELRNATFHHLHLTRLLLTLSGDRSVASMRRGLENVFASVSEDDLASLGEIALLLSNGGQSRFRRTKILSWVLAVLKQKPTAGADGPLTPSTSSHINALLTAISTPETHHSFRESDVLAKLVSQTLKAARLHTAADDAWNPKLRSRRGNDGWEDLPLVATLATCLVLVWLGEEARLIDKVPHLRDEVFKRTAYLPTKTQNFDQWLCIARVVLDTLRAVGVDIDLARAKLAKSGVEALDVFLQLEQRHLNRQKPKDDGDGRLKPTQAET